MVAKENKQPNFCLKNDIFSDISEDEMDHISQELDRVENSGRFAAPLQEKDLENIVKDELCQNTENKTKWAMRILDNWLKQRQELSKSNDKVTKFGTNVLEFTVSELNQALSYFVAEVRNKDGQDYRPNTVYELIISIQHFFSQK